ncbi:MAG: HEPN domain-containing protein [Chloroflexi bacterium]|nr:HEPN domain-containing protein [Chloroflexota bacterium]
MLLDPQKVADTREWLRKALEDLGSAEVLAHPSVGFVGPAVFHCQQAAEKAFKGADHPFLGTSVLVYANVASAPLQGEAL